MTPQTPPRFGAVLAVGGTGMLADASRWLAQRAERTILVARRPASLAAEIGAEGVALDWGDADAAAVLRGLGPVDVAVTWLHDAAAHLARPCEDALRPGGRSVRVHGAGSADAELRAARDPDPRPDVRRQTVILGFHRVAGARRWLSDREISDGVLAAVAAPGRDTIVVGDLDG